MRGAMVFLAILISLVYNFFTVVRLLQREVSMGTLQDVGFYVDWFSDNVS
jgi:hypothetical protein